MRKQIILFWSFLLLSNFIMGQNVNWQPQGNFDNQRLRAKISLNIPIRDTTGSVGYSNMDSIGAIIYKPNDGLYIKDVYAWKRINSDPQLALKSVRRSNDTLYFKNTNDVESPVKMDYYSKAESDQRYVQLALKSVRRSNDTLYFTNTNDVESPINMDYYIKGESDQRYVLSPTGKLTASWIQAWDYAISADIPNITNPDLKYLIVNGNAGDTTFTVTGGTGTADFTPFYAAAAFDKTGNHYFSFLVVRQAGNVYDIDRPLKYNLVNDTIKFMWSSYQGQHMTDYGYRGYADNIYDYHKNLSSKDYKLYSFYPEDNPAVPFTAINGATQGGFIPSTTIPQLFSITTTTINYSQRATMHLIIQQGGVADRGGEWQVNLGKKNGYLETWIGVNRNLPGFAKVLFYLDGVLKRTDTVRGGVQKLTYNYSGASTGTLRVVTGDVQNTAIRVGTTVWYQTDLDTISKVYTGGKILFVGDSWTQHYLNGGVFFRSSPERFKARWVADGGNASDIINVGRGGMTSAWGKYFFKSWLTTYNPKFVYIEFYINDANSSSFVGDNTNTTWNFSSTDPYAAGTDVDGKVSQQQWLDNLKWMKDTALKYGATPILLMNTPTGSLTQTQGQSAWFSALRPATQYYDIETFFTSGVYADKSVNTPTINATVGNVDTVISKVTRGGAANTSLTGSYLIGLRALNSSITKGLIIYPEVSYTGSLGKIVSVQNGPTIGSNEVFSIANNGLTTSSVGFSAGTSGYAIPPFTITYNAAIARISATNSTTVQDLYVGDSLTGVIRLRIPTVLANYTTSTLPNTGIRRVKGALVYDTDVDKAAITNGAIWEYLAKESLVLARYDSNTVKGNFIRNSAAYAGSPQTADILNLGTLRNDGTTIFNGTVRFNFGSDVKYNEYYRDSATGNIAALTPGVFGQFRVAGPAGKPEYRSIVTTDIPNLDAAKITSGIFPIARGGTGLSTIGTSLQQIRVNSGATALEYFTPTTPTLDQVVTAGNTTTLGINTGKVTATSTTEQFRNAYDASNYMGIVTGNTGNTTFSLTGSGSPYFRFNNSIGLNMVPTYPLDVNGGIRGTLFINANGTFQAGSSGDITGTALTVTSIINTGRSGTGIKQVTATASVGGSDEHTFICNNTSNITLTIPAGEAGREFEFKKINSAAATITVLVTSSGTIDGSTSGFVLTNQWSAVRIKCLSPGVWYVMSKID